MFVAGLLYLVFEEDIARRSGRSVSVSGSRIIMGAQVREHDYKSARLSCIEGQLTGLSVL
jgi:hypothetical protein